MKKFLTDYRFVLTLIIIIAVFFRLYNITLAPPGLYPDEAMDGTNAQEALSTAPPAGGFKVFYPENNGREGLFMDIQAPLIAVLGNEPWVLRIVSVFFGIFTVWGMFFLTKELLSYGSSRISKETKIKIALLSTFLIAINFWHINFSRISFRAIMAPFFLVWSLYYLLKSLNHEYSVKYAVYAGIFFGLGFYSYIAYRDLPLLMLIVLIYDWLTRKNFRKKLYLVSMWFILITFIVALPLGIYFLKNPKDFFGRTTQVSIMSSASPIKALATNIVKTAGMFNFVGDWNWRHNFSGRPELSILAGLFFLIGIAVCLYELFKRRRGTLRHGSGQDGFFVSLVIFSMLILAALPVVASNEGIPHALRSILMIPPAFILAGIGGIWLYDYIKTRVRKKFLPILFTFIGIIFLISIWNTYNTYFNLWANDPNTQGAFAADYVDIGHFLNSLPKEVPKYVVVQANGVLVRGIPMPSQTVMFITDTFTPEKQKAKNLYYVLPDQTSQIPDNAYKVVLK